MKKSSQGARWLRLTKAVRRQWAHVLVDQKKGSGVTPGHLKTYRTIKLTALARAAMASIEAKTAKKTPTY